MASIKNTLLLFTILVSSTVTLAKGANSNDSRSDVAPPNLPPGHGHENDSDKDLPQPLSAPGLLDYLPFEVPTELEIPGPELFLSGSRPKRTLNRKVIRCNFLTEGLFRCTDCNTVRHCYPLNVGTETTCSFLLPYCNNGHCSRIKGTQCSATSSSSTSTTMSSSTK